MKDNSASEKLYLKELTESLLHTTQALKGLSVGEVIHTIRRQLGMSQVQLAMRAGVPQATISRLERGKSEGNVATLEKISQALFCDLIIAPCLNTSIDEIRLRQAKIQANQRIAYLKGTMALEGQEPDQRFLNELLQQEITKLLRGSGSRLWG